MRRRKGESDYVCGKSVGKNNCYTYDSSYDSFVLYRDHFFKNLWFGSYGIHNFNQKMQTLGCYLLPTKMGDLLSKLTANFTETNDL